MIVTRKHILRLLYIASFILASCSSLQNDYSYHLQRTKLLEMEDAFSPVTASSTLSADEVIVDHYLGYLKWREFETTRGTVGYPPMSPIEDVLEHVLQSPLFQALKPLPKGGNMHVHEDHHLRRDILLDILWNSTDFDHLYITPENASASEYAGGHFPWTLDFFLHPPKEESWIKVKGHTYYTKSRILQHLNYIGLLRNVSSRHATPAPSDSQRRWHDTLPMWSRVSTAMANVKIKSNYIKAMMRESLAEGVQYLETKKSFSNKHRLYEIDRNPSCVKTHGKCYLEMYHGEKDIDLVDELVDDFKKDNKFFIGMKRIVQVGRQQPKERVLEDVKRSLYLHKLHPDHIVGLDMAGEEDQGRSNRHHINAFLYIQEELQQRFNASGRNFSIFSHAGETSWNDDVYLAGDETSVIGARNNLYEALLLGSKRIGHGLALIKHPYLLQLVKERQIPIEICPVCNHILGTVPDLRHHPAVTFLRMGIPVVLGSDALGVFGFQYFTVDWYMAFLAWGITLRDMKTLASNSLLHSSLSDVETITALKQWESAWNIYIQDMKTKICSHPSSFASLEPLFLETFPENGPALNANFTIHVYGRNFALGICRSLRCKIGSSLPIPASYISNSELTCHIQMPLSYSSGSEREEYEGDRLDENDLYVSFNGGYTYYNTRLMFKFVV